MQRAKVKVASRAAPRQVTLGPKLEEGHLLQGQGLGESPSPAWTWRRQIGAGRDESSLFWPPASVRC